MPDSTFLKRADSPGIPMSSTSASTNSTTVSDGHHQQPTRLETLRSNSSLYGLGGTEQVLPSPAFGSWGALEAKTPPPATRPGHWNNHDGAFSPAFAELALGSFASSSNHNSQSQWNPPLMQPTYRTPSPSYVGDRAPPSLEDAERLHLQQYNNWRAMELLYSEPIADSPSSASPASPSYDF